MAQDEYHMNRKDSINLAVNNNMKTQNLEYMYDPRVLENSAGRALQIDKQNMELIKTLNLIMRRNGSEYSRQKVMYDNSHELRKERSMKIAMVNRQLYDRIRTSVGVYPTSKMNRDRKANTSSMRSKFKSSLSKNGNIASTNINSRKLMTTVPLAILNGPKMRKLSHCFFEFQITDPIRNLGRMIFELYTEIVPITCENFISFCMGYCGLSYKNTPLHRIVSGYLCQGGDVTNFNGTGGTSIYASEFVDENFHLRHIATGILSMWNDGRNRNNSKFNLTFKKLEVLDGRNVVFGRIIHGLPILNRIDALGTQAGRPKKKVIISKCGLC